MSDIEVKPSEADKTLMNKIENLNQLCLGNPIIKLAKITDVLVEVAGFDPSNGGANNLTKELRGSKNLERAFMLCNNTARGTPLHQTIESRCLKVESFQSLFEFLKKYFEIKHDARKSGVSTNDQHLRMQENALKIAECEKIYHDITSSVKVEDLTRRHFETIAQRRCFNCMEIRSLRLFDSTSYTNC